MTSTNDKGIIDTAVDAVSSAAASVGEAAVELRDKVHHNLDSPNEKLLGESAAVKKRIAEEKMKDNKVPTSERLKAAGGVIEHSVEEVVHKTIYEADKMLTNQ